MTGMAGNDNESPGITQCECRDFVCLLSRTDSALSAHKSMGLVRIVFDMLELFGERFLAFLLVSSLALLLASGSRSVNLAVVRPFLSGQHADELRGDAEAYLAVADGRSRGIIDHMRRLAQGKQFQQLRVCREKCAGTENCLAQLVASSTAAHEWPDRSHRRSPRMTMFISLSQIIISRSEPDGDLIGVRAR